MNSKSSRSYDSFLEELRKCQNEKMGQIVQITNRYLFVFITSKFLLIQSIPIFIDDENSEFCGHFWLRSRNISSSDLGMNTIFRTLNRIMFLVGRKLDFCPSLIHFWITKIANFCHSKIHKNRITKSTTIKGTFIFTNLELSSFFSVSDKFLTPQEYKNFEI